MKMHKLNYILLFLLGCAINVSVSAQDMMQRNYNVNSDVIVDVDAKNTNIIIESWDKNSVAIEAFINDGVPQNEATKMMDSWKLTTNGNKNKIQIRSKSDMNINWDVDISEDELNDALAQLPEIMGPIMNNLVNPILQNISENPLPPDLFENMGAINFDYEAYQEEGDAYLERYEKQVDKKFGKDFEKKMEKWAANFEKSVEGDSEEFEKSMEEWGNSFGASMEKWGESFGKKMEAWGKNFEEKMAAKEEAGQKMPNMIVINRNNEGTKAQRTIKIKAPKNAQIRLNVRYGKVELDNADNLMAELSHANFKANRISGKNTHIKVSYTPVKISNWDYGVLNASYLPSCDINAARSIKLISNSSDVNINRLSEVGILSGTFGNLAIKNLGGSFKNLDITLENSDLKLKLPQSAFRFNYNGNQSDVEYPGTLKVDKTSSYDNEILKGYYKSSNSDAQISISARFSDVLLN
ncbi:hypothetical protein SAMN04487907_10843 [Zunongwangia mangrovi]|uniref:Adhesin domain-containing protein n=1 Tax=Zunongwangia mangrovi TaxID=1334022 RepID=A0A1I1LK88_9FLAO|nr:hypothetical protein [Zunongwangia mangrovi]SFC73617.1 hypothetical protein SAMN04487907_10843 [Zunongwangia mangrovi]